MASVSFLRDARPVLIDTMAPFAVLVHPAGRRHAHAHRFSARVRFRDGDTGAFVSGRASCRRRLPSR